MSALLEESEKKGVKLAKEVDKLSSKLQDLEVWNVVPVDVELHQVQHQPSLHSTR